MAIKPLPINRFWQRRVCEAVMFVTGVILVIYGWNLVAPLAHLEHGTIIPLYAAAAAGICFIGSLVLYFVELPSAFAASLISYYLFAAAILVFLAQTGYLASRFIVLWLLLAVFAPVFGWFGVGFVLFASFAYAFWTVLQGTFTFSELGNLTFTSLIPLIIGWLAWQRRAEGDETKKLYHELASKLSSVSGQSEVVIAAISNGVIAVDNRNNITLINPAATHLIGWGKEDAIGLDYHSVFELGDSRDQPVTDEQNPVQQALTSGREVTTDKLHLVTNDSNKRVQVSITASPISGGGAIVVFRDITNERAEERQQAEFISTASHEMRTPVASIEGYLGLALNPATAQIDAKARDFITKAHESAQHLGRLFQDLLDVSKADDGRLQNNPKVVDVVPFTHDIILGLLPKAHEKALFVNFKPNPDFENTDSKPTGYAPSIGHEDSRIIAPAYYVNVDNDHLREVIGNLVENAIKYTLRGSVDIDVTGDNDHVIISIADSGIGIPTEDIPHLFQKFYRVDNSDTREIGGTGLGLYLCRRLIETMGGKIWVESTYKKGSTFYVQLPRLDSVEAQRMIEQTEPLPEISDAQPINVLPDQPATVPAPAVPQVISAPQQPMPAMPQPQYQAPAPVAPAPQPMAIPVYQYQQPVAAPQVQQPPVAPPQPVYYPQPQPAPVPPQNPNNTV